MELAQDVITEGKTQGFVHTVVFPKGCLCYSVLRLAPAGNSVTAGECSNRIGWNSQV